MELSRYLKVYPCTGKPGRVMLLATRRCAVLELSEWHFGAGFAIMASFRTRDSRVDGQGCAGAGCSG